MPVYDAVLVVSFGGPEKHDDVIPFLENVTRDRNVPPERLLEVARHYYHFDGRSPINQQTRDLVDALKEALAHRGPGLPVYWGNRNWHPMLDDTVRQMTADGIRRAIAIATSAFSSYSSCRQYLENIESARCEHAPRIDKLPPFWNEQGFLEAMADRVKQSGPAGEVIFTAHSIPLAMERTCRYESELNQACTRVAALAGVTRWKLVYQSRSGPPHVPWLEPDICRYLRSRMETTPVIIAPIGFLSDHIEVLWDLDQEAGAVCREAGIPMIRAATVGVHPKFVETLRSLIAQAVLNGITPCPHDCCPRPA